MIAIIDYKMGNIGSLTNALSFLGFPYIVTNKEEEILAADKIILPGVGAFKDAIKLLKESNLDKVLMKANLMKKPILGICLGFQLLFTSSSEFGYYQGLNLVDGDIKQLKLDGYKVPHIGWNSITFNKECPLYKGIPDNSYLYFVHSYAFFDLASPSALSYTTYGVKFVSSIWNDNIYGVQFHPEKSGEIGLKILKNFGEL